MIHSFTATFGAKYLTGMVTSVPPYETFSLIKNNILHQSKNYKNHFENSISEVCDLGYVGHVTYSFINMLFISMGMLDDNLRPQILSVGTTANAPLSSDVYNSQCHKLFQLWSHGITKTHFYLYFEEILCIATTKISILELIKDCSS